MFNAGRKKKPNSFASLFFAITELHPLYFMYTVQTTVTGDQQRLLIVIAGNSIRTKREYLLYCRSFAQTIQTAGRILVYTVNCVQVIDRVEEKRIYVYICELMY
jgi:hypothetical protein